MKLTILKIIWYNEVGRLKVLGRISGVIPQAMMIFTFFKVYGITITIPIMIGVVILWYIAGIICGYLFIKFNLLKIEKEFDNEQNITLQKILKK